MATKKISELEAINTADNSDVLVVVDVSENTTNKITKSDLLKEVNAKDTQQDSDIATNTQNINANTTAIDTNSINISINATDIATNTQNINANTRAIRTKANITETGNKIDLEINNSTFKIKAKLYDKNDNLISTSSEIDLPLESVVVNASYDSTNKALIITLQNGNTTSIDVSDLISGLVSETDYATYNKGGVIKGNVNGFTVGNTGNPGTSTYEYNQYINLPNYQFIGKGTLENAIIGKNLETANNKVSEMDENSTNEQYPTAKIVYEEFTKLKAENAELKIKVTDLENNRSTSVASGTSIDLSDSSDSEVVSIELEGNSVQETTEGKNKCNSSVYKNNYIIDNEGNEISSDRGYISEMFPIESNTNYIITYNTVDTSYGFRIAEYDENQNFIQRISINSTGSSFTTSQMTKYMRISTLKNDKNIMLRLASITDDTYEPYTGGQASPNPDYEQPVKSCGENVNELPNNQVTTNVNGLDFIVNSDKSITVRGIATAQTDFYFVGNANQYENLGLIKDDYILNGCIGGSGLTYMLYLVRNRGGEISYFQNYDKGGTQISIKENDTFRIFIRVLKNQTVDTVFYPKLEQGTVATPYSLYGMGCITEKVGNKNLVNVENGDINPSSGEEFQGTDACRSKEFEPIKYNQSIVASGYEKITGLVPNLRLYDINKKYIGYSAFNQNGVFTNNNSEVAYFKIRYTIQGYTPEQVNSTLQIEYGTVATDYVKHQEQLFTIPTQQPMRSIGDVRDKFSEGENAERHNLISVTFDGSDDESWSNQFGASLFGINLSNKKINISSLAYSNYFIFHNIQSGLNNNLAHGEFSIQIGTVDTLYIKNTDFTTIADFKNWLSTHNVEVIYQLATPQDLPCTAEQTEALEALSKARTYKNITHFSSEDEVEPFIEVEYVIDNETKIQSLEARIEALEALHS